MNRSNIPIVVIFIYYYIFFVITIAVADSTTTKIVKTDAVAFLVRSRTTTQITTERKYHRKHITTDYSTNKIPIQSLFRWCINDDSNNIFRRKHHLNLSMKWINTHCDWRYYYIGNRGRVSLFDNNIVLYNSETNYNSLPSSSPTRTTETSNLSSESKIYTSSESSIVTNNIEYKSDESELDMLKNLLAQLENNNNNKNNDVPIGTNHNNNRNDNIVNDDNNNSNDSHLLLLTSSNNKQTNTIDFMDVPRPTVNGGYSHTSASRAKISAANRGKVPWNKGKQRSDEVRLRIAAGVRAKNRERFLLKLNLMNITEEQYEQQQMNICNKVQAERLSRRTDKGGYRPTEETKLKISKILKEKYANGEIKLKQLNTNQNNNNNNITSLSYRKGFHHSNITKQRISDSLKRLWETNETYRINMINKSLLINSRYDVRQKIGTSLREKWNNNHTYRQYMITAFSNRNNSNTNTNSVVRNSNINNNTVLYDMIDDDSIVDGSNMFQFEERIITLTHRERISLAMKEKWKNETYRTLALAGFAKKKNNNMTTTTTDKQRQRRSTTTSSTRSSSTSSSISVASPKIPKNNNNTTKLKVSNPIRNNMKENNNNRFDNYYKNQGIGTEIVQHNMNDDTSYTIIKDEDSSTSDLSPIRVLQPLTQPRTKKSRNERKQRSLVSSSTTNPIQLVENIVIRPAVNHEVSQRSSRSSSSNTSVSSSGGSNLNGYLEELKDHVDNMDIEDTLIHLNDDDDDDDILLMEQFMEKSVSQQKTSSGITKSTKLNNSANKKSSSNGGSNGENIMGSVNRLQEERPDLYELLYGFEEENNDEYNNNNNNNNRMHANGRITGSYFNNKKSNNNNNNNNIVDSNNNFIPLLSKTLGDENLDTFDPYGLEDF